jgi:hypothetical protein
LDEDSQRCPRGGRQRLHGLAGWVAKARYRRGMGWWTWDVVRGVIAVGRVAWEHCGSSSEWRERAKRRDCEKGCWMAGLETSQWASAVDLDGRGACQHVRERESSSDEGGMCDAMFGGVKQSAGTRGRTVGRHHHSPVAAGSKAFKAMTGSRDRFPWERNGVCVWWLVVGGCWW